MLNSILLSVILSTGLSFILTPLIIKVAGKLGIVAKKNDRTIHQNEVTRIGGVAIFLTFMIIITFFLRVDRQINAILLGGFIIFLVGFYDDIHNLRARYKLLGQIIAGLVVIIGGEITIKGFYFLPRSITPIVSLIVTLVWIVGVTNAINLIDGLDGLSAGISIIVLVTISITSYLSLRSDIAAMSLILAGSTLGFLYYNFHPAKLFMGDSGALFLGFMISVISLLGFGYSISTFFTLGAPIVVLMVPILDTLTAIVRRKVHHKKMSEADRNHLHHKLMFKLNLGQRKSVLSLYGVTLLFSLASYLYYIEPMWGIILFIVILFGFELFVEATKMISSRYCIILGFVNLFLKSDKLPRMKRVEKYLNNRSFKQKIRDRIIILLIIVGLGGSFLFVNMPKLTNKKEEIPYLDSIDLDICHEIYNDINKAYEKNERTDLAKLVGYYFTCGFFSFSDKKDLNDVGALDYVHKTKRKSLKDFAVSSYYLNQVKYPKLEVKSYKLLSFRTTNIDGEDVGDDAKFYNMLLSITYNQEVSDLPNKVKLTITYSEGVYSIIGVDILKENE